MSNDVLLSRPRRRYYSNELKAEIVKSCAQPGASLAAIALSHGINANIVHRWVRERGANLTVQAPQNGFIEVSLKPRSDPELTHQFIEIEFRRGMSSASVRWPSEASDACVALLRDWLR